VSDGKVRPLQPSSGSLLGFLTRQRGRRAGAHAHLLRTRSSRISPGLRTLGWIVGSAVFAASLVLWFGLVHGPTGPISPTGDEWESGTPAAAIEHGMLACAYPAQAQSSVPPLYPLVAAGILTATAPLPAIGPWTRSTPCPGNRGSSPGYPEWSFLLTGLVAWPVLLAGYIVVVRAAERDRTRLELLGLWVIAAFPPLAGAYVQYFHPEDVLALGLVLAAVGLSLRHRWILAGVCCGLACCSKQYAILAVVALVTSAPRGARSRILGATVGTAGGLFLVLTPLMGTGLLTSSLGAYATLSNGSTLVGWLGLHGALRTLVARGLPLAGAAALAGAARHRLGPSILRPVPLLGLVTGSLVLRLAFEINLYSYYFVAVGVCLVTLDVVGGRIRPVTLAWLVATGAFYPPAFDVLVPIQERAPQLVQAGLVVGALALSLRPVLASRASAPQSLAPSGLPLRLPAGSSSR